MTSTTQADVAELIERLLYLARRSSWFSDRELARKAADTLAALSARLAEVEAENVRLQKENGIRQRRIERLEKLHRDIIAYQAGKAEQ